jgi:tRNA-dihydrouridine synthase
MAPLEGITGFIYRNAHAKYFGKMDKYFTPFLSPTMLNVLTPKEKKEILPDNNKGLRIVPQLLTNKAEHFINAAKELETYGYQEVNLNLGCPSGTVVAKRKGSGFLGEKKELEQFLETVCSNLNMKISIKTRIGIHNAEEHGELSALFNKFPLEELIIHPRIQKDFYKNKPDLEVFEKMSACAKHPICYNGDIFQQNDYQIVQRAFPKVNSFMLGRGLIQNPNLANEIKGGNQALNMGIKKPQLEGFLNEVFEGYRELMGEDRNAMFRMKELWSYLIVYFPGCEKLGKKIYKSQSKEEYNNIVQMILETM